MMKRPLSLAIMLGILVPVGMSHAHTWRNRSSIYTDSGGTSRNRFKLDLDFKLAHESSALSNSSYTIAASQEQMRKDISEDEYSEKYYHNGRRTTDVMTLNAGHTWSKLTDTRVVGSYSTDGVMRSRTVGGGASRWFWHENLQLGFDLSRTVVEQPLYETLGADSDVVAAPELVSSTGTTFTSKYLANPTTITTLTYSHIEKNDRPPANIYSAAVKQFIPPTKSAVHAEVARAFNQGRVTNDTDYGEVDAWIAELAFLQTLWRGANTKASYRYYKEDETTRVEGNQFVRGSDLYGIFFSQEFAKGRINTLTVPLVIEASASQYRTNQLEDGEKLFAEIYEAGVLAKF